MIVSLVGMPDPQPNTRPLILVVEDEALVRMTLVDVLDDAGFKVIEAAHADEALRVLKAVSDIQAVVTDVEMPRGSINGFELARRVRDDRQDIGVLIASGRAAPQPGDLPDGALFIGKPVHPGTLVRLLKTLLSAAQD
jgi:CheY-like chemotaxis protein